MKPEKTPQFTPIDYNTWPRKFYFDYYFNQVKCTYSLTLDLDITSLLAHCKKSSIKLYPALIHVISSAVNQIEELRISFNEQDELVTWNFLSPCYTVFHDDDKIFTNIWTAYTSDFNEFNLDYLQDIEAYGKVKQFIAKPNEPENTFPISCLPWLNFTGLNLNIYNDAQYLRPIFTLGKYIKKEDKVLIPLSMQLHHALCDGYHASQLFEKIQTIANQFGD